MNRTTIVIVGLLMLLGSFPATSANHLSQGGEYAVTTGPTESTEDRSVPGTTVADKSTAYGVGTSTDCHDPAKEASVEEARETLNADGFCGMLVYHEDQTGLTHVSQPDQHYPDGSPIGTFDVVRTRDQTAGTTTCLPFCQSDNGQPAGGTLAFDAVHTVGAAAGLTEEPGQARPAEDEDGSRSQNYTTAVHVVGPGPLLQENGPVWEYNGWWIPAFRTTFVAYVQDKAGNPVDQADLNEFFKEADLAESAEPTICAYTPDFQFTSVGPGAAGLNCEFEFQEHNPEDDSLNDDPPYDGYSDECESPTYTCGSQSPSGKQGVWYSQSCFCIGLVDPKIPGSDPLPIPGSTLAGPEGQTDHIRWHHVIAPHNSECGGAQEPGFSFDSDGGTLPYLAHEVDVYTTAGSVAATDAGAAVPEVFDYSDQLAEDQTEEVAPTIEDAEKTLDDTVAGLPGTPGGVGATQSQFVKEDTQEPNIAHTVGALDDTSRSKEIIERKGATDPCSKLFRPEDNPENVDPWVDIVDSHAQAVQDVAVDGTYLTDERIRQRVGAYGTTGSGQDGTNRPGPSLYQTSGNVGMFTDTDNDGEYDALEAGIKYNSQNIRTGGAYPMMWNMWANENGTVNAQSNDACGLGTGGSTPMPEAMQQLGYGVNTGLAQAIYLKEPTAFVANQTVAEYEAGDNVYVLLSQAARQLWDRDLSTESNPLDERVDHVVRETLEYADGQTSADLSFGEDVKLPAERIGLDAAFTDQCSGYTGNFDSNVQFVHDCSTDCSGDTIATLYTFELTGTTGKLEGSEILPTFSVGGETYDFGSGQHTWVDVDAFDNNPNRNEQRKSPPPNPDSGYAGEGLSD